MTMVVVDPSIVPIENIPTHHRGKYYKAPVQTKSIDTKSIRDKRRVDAEKCAVGCACQDSDDGQIVRVVNLDCKGLSNSEQAARNEEAPEAGCVQTFDKEV